MLHTCTFRRTFWILLEMGGMFRQEHHYLFYFLLWYWQRSPKRVFSGIAWIGTYYIISMSWRASFLFPFFINTHTVVIRNISRESSTRPFTIIPLFHSTFQAVLSSKHIQIHLIFRYVSGLVMVHVHEIDTWPYSFVW